MLSSKKSRGLGVSPYQRKYLGESSDPHFIPKSPIIERQKFSDKEEHELRKLCALALADVPHSDAMMDDPFRYISRQRANTTKSAQAKKSESSRSETAPPAPPQISSQSSKSTTTLSDVSVSHKFKTNDSTAVTTPGAPNPETRPTTTTNGMFKSDTVYSFLKDNTTSRSAASSATKSMTNLAISAPRRKSKTPANEAKAKFVGLGNPNFNKSLPALPRIMTREERKPLETQENEDKPSAFSRMLKTVHLHKTKSRPPMPARRITTDVPAELELAMDQVDEISARRQRRFNITHIFHKSGGPKRATVF